jgi:S-formylglutathione hydrolase FrmB
VRDVVQYVDSHFRTLPSAEARGLAGHGIGGLGALELALAHPEVFGCVYAMSPALFDANGLSDFGIANPDQLRKWQELWRQWDGLCEQDRRHRFRDYIQTRLNSPNRKVSWEGFCLAYTAAVAPDPTRPYPHIAIPSAGASGTVTREFREHLEEGMGGWEGKVARYLAKGQPLRLIVLEYGRDDEYAGLRRGSDYVAAMMRSRGMAVALEIHGGTHDSALRKRLETGMLPAMAKALNQSGS